MMLLLFRTTYCIVKNNFSLRSFPVLLSLQEYNGLSLGSAYRNTEAISAFISCIAEVEQREVINKINSQAFFSIMLDGSTDKSTVEQEIVYARILSDGKPENVYLGLMTVNGTTAVDIAQELGEFLMGLGVVDWKARMVGLGTDGASVNTGCHNGLGICS